LPRPPDDDDDRDDDDDDDDDDACCVGSYVAVVLEGMVSVTAKELRGIVFEALCSLVANKEIMNEV
jgi:hypothetical protein